LATLAERQTTRAAQAPVTKPAVRSRSGLTTAALVLAVLVTRVPFMTQTLYGFDSANYALAVGRFYNVAFHQPHPPGYPLYVALARAFDLVLHDANRSLVVESIGWSTLAVGCTVALGRRLYGSTAGLLAGFLLAFTVGFWGYGEVAYPYVALAGETASLALLAHLALAGHRRAVVAFGVAWAVAVGVRWDGAVFCVPLWVWLLWRPTWRLRVLSISLALAGVVAFAIPTVMLSGGWDTYRATLSDYLRVWSPQSAFVVGDYASGGETQAGYNLNFLVNYLRQMLGVGLLLVPYLLGRRFGPASLAADGRSRFLAVWTLPPLLVYVFAHLGEPGYVLSLAPQAAILGACAAQDLGHEADVLALVLRTRAGWFAPRLRAGAPVERPFSAASRPAHPRRATPAAPPWDSRASAASASRGVASAVTGLIVLAIVAWNVQAFLRGTGPGRLPDLRAHDLTTSAQVAFVQAQPRASTLVLAHDILRQVQFYVPEQRVELLYSEYLPGWERARTRTELPEGTAQVVVLDSAVETLPVGASRVHEIVLREPPQRVSVWVVDVRGQRAVEHGYRYLKVLPI
jgi:hypothetical protein